MSETNAQEPTMEEILASIRRIISEDDTPAPVAASESAAEPKAAEPTPTPAAVHAPSPVDDDVLELTDAIEPPRAAAPEPEPVKPEPPKPALAAQPKYEETLGDLDVFSSEPAPAPRAPAPKPAAPSFAEEPLVGSYAAEASAGHFGALARTIAMPKDGRTLEDLVREMLKPLLRDWLDQNLSAIVEARVQAEVERISRLKEF